MVRVFISQPMWGRTPQEIEDERDEVFADIASRYAEQGEDCEEIPSYFGEKGAAQMKPLECLGKSLELMAHADVAVFCKGWWKARGCRIEHDCARQYGIEVIELL
jgi:hypothetical protein